MKARFSMERKMVVQVRYYDYLYVIRDKSGERVYTGPDEKTAKLILKALNGYTFRRTRAKELAKRKKRKYKKGKV